MARITITKIQCIVNDETDKDEVFLKYDGKKIWPSKGLYKQIDNSETFDVDVTIEVDDPHKPVVIELWDFDYLSANDFLGFFQMTIGNDTSGSFSTSMTLKEKHSTASYIMHWELS